MVLANKQNCIACPAPKCYLGLSKASCRGGCGEVSSILSESLKGNPMLIGLAENTGIFLESIYVGFNSLAGSKPGGGGNSADEGEGETAECCLKRLKARNASPTISSSSI